MLSCTPVEQISGKVRLVLCLQWSSHCRIGEFNNGKDQLDVYGNSTMLHALDHFPMLTTGSLSSFKDRKTNLLAYQINKLTGFFFNVSWSLRSDVYLFTRQIHLLWQVVKEPLTLVWKLYLKDLWLSQTISQRLQPPTLPENVIPFCYVGNQCRINKTLYNST